MTNATLRSRAIRLWVARQARRQMQSPGSLAKMVGKYQRKHIVWALRIIPDAYGEKKGMMRAMLIKSLTEFAKQTPDADRERMLKVACGARSASARTGRAGLRNHPWRQIVHCHGRGLKPALSQRREEERSMNDTLTLISSLSRDGKSPLEIAQELHTRGEKDARGRTITPAVVEGLLRFAELPPDDEFTGAVWGSGTKPTRRSEIDHDVAPKPQKKRKNRWRPPRCSRKLRGRKSRASFNRN